MFLSPKIKALKETFTEKMDLYCLSGPSPSLFKSKHICIRMYYSVHGDVSYFHTLRTTGTRLFNNMIIHIKNDEEARGSSLLQKYLLLVSFFRKKFKCNAEVFLKLGLCMLRLKVIT